LLARHWRRKLIQLEPPNVEPSLHWTPRDKEAWQLVEARVQVAEETKPDDFTTVDLYLDIARDLSEEIARHYYPKGNDPFGSLTIPEILAAAQLAMEDLSKIYDQYVPGGSLITVDHWRSISQLPKHYKKLSNIATAASALFSPLAAAGRYVAAKTIMAPVTKALRSNVLSWFYKSYIQRVGFYVIEMNSGRLRGGPKHFREMSERLSRSKDKPWTWPEDSPTEVETTVAEKPEIIPESSDNKSPEKTVAEICICLVGQTGSGKSSLAKIFHGNRSVEAKPYSKKSAVMVHELSSSDSNELLLILDTRGYAASEQNRQIDKDLQQVLPDADLVLLTMNITSSARATDLQFLENLSAWYSQHAHLKPPPVIAVLTHIDLLRPVMEWEPPYDFQNPKRPKEQTIRDAIEHNRADLEGRVARVIAICSDIDRDRVFGLQEELLPAITAVIDEARACGSLRDLHANLDTGKLRKVLGQVVNVSRSLRGK
jgi:hypothetical protein